MNLSLLSSFTVAMTESCYPGLFRCYELLSYEPSLPSYQQVFSLNAIEELLVLGLEFVPVWPQFLRMENILPE